MKPRRYAVAFSFPGEHREYVEKVAQALHLAFGGQLEGKKRIFYDAWHESKVIGYSSSRKLQEVYAREADLIVPFYCKEYLKKNWCGVELRAIEELLFDNETERVLPFRFDMVDIPGSFKTDIFPIVTGRPHAEIAQLILERYEDLQQTILSQEPKNASTLAQAVDTSSRYRSTRSPQALSRLCDRSSQIGSLERFFLQADRTTFRRPILVVIHGDQSEAHGALVERLIEGELPSQFDAIGFGKEIQDLEHPNALTAKDPENLAREIRMKLVRRLEATEKLPPGTQCKDDVELRDCFRRSGHKVLMPVFRFNSGEAFADDGCERCYISMIRDFWAAFPDLPEGMALFNLLCVKYVEPPAAGFWERFLPSKRRPAHMELRKTVKELGSGPPAAGGVRIIHMVLDELKPVGMEHVAQWFEHPKVDGAVKRLSVRSIQEKIFKDRATLPMDEVLEALEKLIITG